MSNITKSQRNESIELQNQFSISETYDLLSSTAPIIRKGNQFLLRRPADTGNLKQICFRSFNPIVKRSISELQTQTITVTIYPMIFDENSTNLNGYKLYNMYDQQRLEVGLSTMQVLPGSSINTMLTNINEAIAGYCDSFKSRNSYFIFTNDSNTYTLTSTVEDYYNNNIKPLMDNANIVAPQNTYTTVTSNDNTEFFTNNGIFNMVDPTGNVVYMFFCVDVDFKPYDLFNVSPYRQFFNVHQFIKAGGEHACIDNDCISTSVRFTELLTALQLNSEGYNLVLKSSLMKNLTGIVYVNKTEAQIVMKGSNEQSAINYVDVSLTDIDGNEVSEQYLDSIYSSILIDVDFVFDGLL